MRHLKVCTTTRSIGAALESRGALAAAPCSTVLLLLGGLDRPTSGSVLFEERVLGALPESELAKLRAAEFGFVFQTFNLIPTLTAQANVETSGGAPGWASVFGNDL